MKIISQLTLAGLLIISGLIPVFGQSRFSVSFNLAPIYGHTDFKSIAPIPDPDTQSPTTEIVSNQRGVGYWFGLMGRYEFSPKWSASVGIRAGHGLSTTGYISLGSINIPLHYQYSHPFQNAYAIPLLLNYQSSTKRLSPYFSAGVTLNFRSASYVDINGEEVPVKFGKAITITPLAGAGIIYRLTQKLSLIAQPTIQYNVQSHPTYAYYHSYGLSLQTQLLYHF